MGAIFAIEKDGVVYLAADAVKKCCDVELHVNKETNFKIHKMPSDIIVASCGPMIVTQQLWLHDEWFELDDGEAFDKRFIVTKLIPKLYNATKNFDVWEEEFGDFVNSTEAGFIIARGGDIYMICNNLSVVKCEKLAAVSDARADMLMLAYANACTDDNPEMVIKKAFEFASGRTATVSTHGIVINTRDQVFKKMEEIG